MRVVGWSELAACPAGTIFCDLLEGYADSLMRKGDGDEAGFWQEELLPQDLGTLESPAFLEATWRGPPHPRDAATLRFFVFDPADLSHMIARMSPR